MRNESDIYALVIGKIVASLREEKGWTQSDLVSRVGITQSNLSRIERGQTTPDSYTQKLLAEAFGRTPSGFTNLVEEAFGRAKRAAAAASKQTDDDEPWWKTALAVAGVVGLTGLVVFAVGATIIELTKEEMPSRTTGENGSA